MLFALLIFIYFGATTILKLLTFHKMTPECYVNTTKKSFFAVLEHQIFKKALVRDVSKKRWIEVIRETMKTYGVNEDIVRRWRVWIADHSCVEQRLR